MRMSENIDFQKLWKSLKKKKNVVGLSESLQRKIISGKETDLEAVRVYVSRKVPRYLLEAEDLVPPTIQINGKEYLTDVVEIGYIVALGSPREAQQKHRPVKGGVSAMGYWEGSTACTLTCMAKLGDKIGFLANNHCLANTNKAPLGTPYLQPSPYDGGVYPDDRIGSLEKYVPINLETAVCPYRNLLYKILNFFGRSPTNRVDSAFAVMDEGIPYKLEILNMGGFKYVRRPYLYEKVQKMGRTTGHTTNGVVVDLNWSGYVQYQRGSAFFRDCMLIEGRGFCSGGDSSSPIKSLDDPEVLLGQLFAGSDTHTIACYIDNIERELGVEVIHL